MAQRPTSTSQSVRPDFAELNDLVSNKCGGEVLFSTDDWFAVAENLLQTSDPEFKVGVYTPYGKWMDGWETRRKREAGHDWCVIQLGIPGVIKGFDFNTAFFTGNYTPKVSVQAACMNDEMKEFPQRSVAMGTKASEEEWKAINAFKTEEWEEILSRVALKPGYQDTCHNYLPCNSSKRWTHIRVNMYPDGGIARLHVFGQAVRDWSKEPPNKMIDLVAMENGGICVGYSDVHFGHSRNLISPGLSSSMADGWETARRMDRPDVYEVDKDGYLLTAGKEWCVFRLGCPGTIKEIEIDTSHFKGNFPDSCTIEGCVATEKDEERARSQSSMKAVGQFDNWEWKSILPIKKIVFDRSVTNFLLISESDLEETRLKT
ncbi:allantoicase-like [Glandiceps talaboti]